MAPKAGLLATIITASLILAYPLVLHVFVVKNAAGWLGIALALLPVVGFILWCAKQSRHPLIVAAAVAAAIVHEDDFERPSLRGRM